MPLEKYVFVHPESPFGLMFANLRSGQNGKGHPDYTLVAVTPIGLYVLRRRSWLEKLLGLS